MLFVCKTLPRSFDISTFVAVFNRCFVICYTRLVSRLTKPAATSMLVIFRLLTQVKRYISSRRDRAIKASSIFYAFLGGIRHTFAAKCHFGRFFAALKEIFASERMTWERGEPRNGELRKR